MEPQEIQKIEKDFLNQIEDLRSSIERIGMRQDELKGYIFEVTESINELRGILARLPKNEAKAKSAIHINIQKNYEVISKFYDNISSFESVRNRYQENIGRLTKEKLYFLNVEIRKIEEKTDSSTGSVLKFMKELRGMISELNENPTLTNKVLGSLENHPEYSMD